mgnify:FL=1|jgi:hypothetical protein
MSGYDHTASSIDIGTELTTVLYNVFIVRWRELQIISRGNGRRVALEKGCVDLFCCSVYQKDDPKTTSRAYPEVQNTNVKDITLPKKPTDSPSLSWIFPVYVYITKLHAKVNSLHK